jgi:UDP-N-acetylmuramate dehydrogenase
MTEKSLVSPKLPMATLLAAFGPNIEFSRELRSLTSYQTGGSARYFVECHTADEIVRAMEAARKLEIPYFVLGGGTNLLISDEGYDGLIIKVNVTGIRVSAHEEIVCGAGEELMALVNFATVSGLSGMEFAAGIWGSVGGAIYGNAGAFGGEIGNVITEVTLVGGQMNSLRTEPGSYCQFAYRDSYLKTTHEVVVDARLRLRAESPEKIQETVNDILAQRQTKHPDSLTAGCFFKNIPDPKEKFGKLPAGRLLEEIGAKGMQVGGAKVFDKHANIIVNTGTATSKDIRQLADIMKQKVRDRFGIELQEEVQQIGQF